MNLEAIMVSEIISQADKDKYYVFSLIRGILRIKQTNEYNKTETDSLIQRTRGYQRERSGRGRGKTGKGE